MKVGRFPLADRYSVGGGSGAAFFKIPASGDEGKVTVTVVLEKRAVEWVITDAGYPDSEGKYVDITVATPSQSGAWASETEDWLKSSPQVRIAGSEKSLKEELSKREKSLGPDHPAVATSLKNLAKLYYLERDYSQVEPLLRRALEIHEKALGPDHPRVAQSLENYAALLRKTNRGSEAAKMEARAKRIRAKL